MSETSTHTRDEARFQPTQTVILGNKIGGKEAGLEPHARLRYVGHVNFDHNLYLVRYVVGKKSWSRFPLLIAEYCETGIY